MELRWVLDKCAEREKSQQILWVHEIKLNIEIKTWESLAPDIEADVNNWRQWWTGHVMKREEKMS